MAFAERRYWLYKRRLQCCNNETARRIFRQPSGSFGVLKNQEKEDAAMANQSTFVPATEGQMKLMRRLVEDAAEQAAKQLRLGKDATQRLIELGVGRLTPRFVALFSDLALTQDSVESTHGYFSGYDEPRPLAEQMVTLKQIFPKLEWFDQSVAAKGLLAGAEGNFLIPRWQELASTYGEAVDLVLAALKRSYGCRFVNHREVYRLRESAKKAYVFETLINEQKGRNTLVVQAQFGARYRGRSIQGARLAMSGDEVGLGVFEVGCMLLTHPNRLKNSDDLYVDCAGDEYAPYGSDGLRAAPYFSLGHDEYLRFSARELLHPSEHYGSVSAFMTPSVELSE